MGNINDFLDPKTAKAIKLIAKELLEVGANLDTVFKASKRMNEELGKVVPTQEKLNEERREAEKLDKQLQQTTAKLITLDTQRNKLLVEAKEKVRLKNKEIKDEIRLDKLAKDSLAAKRIELAKMKKAYTEASAEVAKKMLPNLKKMTKEVTKLEKAMGVHTRGVGGYSKALMGVGRQLIGALGVVGGVSSFISVIKDATGRIVRFDKASASLAAILGKTKEEVRELTELGRQYARVTKFTASEVVNAEEELAKLGLTQDEIGASLKAVLDFAAAADTTVPQAAKVAASAMRALDKPASELEDIVSTLAVSTTKSAINFSALETGLSTFLPVGNAFKFSLEEQVALFGKLVDSGFDYSMAATALRNILLNLANTSGGLAKELGGNVTNFDELIPALVTLRKEGVSLNETLELTDKRSVAAFNAFLNQAEGAKELKDSITGVNADLKTLVDTRMDSVEGATQRLNSAWEDWILNLNKSSGALQTFLDNLAEGINNLSAGTPGGAGGFFMTVLGIGSEGREAIKKNTEDVFSILKALSVKETRDMLSILATLRQAQLDEGANVEAMDTARRIRFLAKSLVTKVKLEEDARLAALEAEEQAAAEANRIAEKRELDLLEVQRKSDKKFQEYFDKTVEEDEALEEERLAEAEAFEEFKQQRLLEIKEKYAEKEKDLNASLEEARRQLVYETLSGTLELSQAFAEREKQNLKSKLDNQALSEEDYQAKIAELNVKQAKLQKANALLNIATTSAEAIFQIQAQASVLASNPVTAPLAALALAQIPIVLGGAAVQTGLVLAQPIPQFYKGTKSAPAGLLSVAERGEELIEMPDGSQYLASTPTLASGLEGATIFNNQETKQIIAESGRKKAFQDFGPLRKDLKDIRKAIESKKEYYLARKGRRITERTGNFSKTYHDRMMNR